MTLLESKVLPLPLPADFKHKRLPLDLWHPPHINDVRFDFKPWNIGRRCFRHDTYMNSYRHGDAAHGVGHVDEDWDGELPDPIENMHFKRKRNPIFWTVFFVIWACLFFGYATVGLKVPQHNNPIFYRKKYASGGAIHQ